MDVARASRRGSRFKFAQQRAQHSSMNVKAAAMKCNLLAQRGYEQEMIAKERSVSPESSRYRTWFTGVLVQQQNPVLYHMLCFEIDHATRWPRLRGKRAVVARVQDVTVDDSRICRSSGWPRVVCWDPAN